MTAPTLFTKLRARATWSAQERAEWVELFENSGQTVVEFCRQHDLAPATLAFWRSQRRVCAARPLPAPACAPALEEDAFVEVPLAALNAGCAPACATAVTVRLTSGMQLEILSGTDPGWLGELLAALRE